MAHHQGYPRQARQGGSLLHPRASSHSRHDGARMNSDPHPPPTTKARSSNTQRRTQILLTNCPTEQRDARAQTPCWHAASHSGQPNSSSRRSDPNPTATPRPSHKTTSLERNSTRNSQKEFDGPRTPSTASLGWSGARPQIGRRARWRSDLGPGKRMRGRRRESGGTNLWARRHATFPLPPAENIFFRVERREEGEGRRRWLI
ncbi:hypothetical protein PVAP13_3NG079740 [Panicum virgatum]|uniref:Uncharacterized protein n=1 Tax=Panicum virgatum TaxID=38727 RepID=A0A8T0UCL7_PANVG|nr:hypothetical protein PVAP13_3NG079740 [Panicum virgatum]